MAKNQQSGVYYILLHLDKTFATFWYRNCPVQQDLDKND